MTTSTFPIDRYSPTSWELLVTDIAAALLGTDEALGALTCSEADTLALHLARGGLKTAAAQLLATHAIYAEEEGDAHWDYVGEDGNLTAEALDLARSRVSGLVDGSLAPGQEG